MVGYVIFFLLFRGPGLHINLDLDSFLIMNAVLRTVCRLSRNRESSAIVSAPCRSSLFCRQSHIRGDSYLLNQLHDISGQKEGPFATGEEVLDSVVKIFSVTSKPNFFSPWQNHSKREGSGSGFVVSSRLILTNAHVVADSTFIQVKRHGSGTKFSATIQAIGHEVDLALLSVEEEEFWTSPTEIRPLELFDGLPDLQEHVAVIGFPQGGDNTSITKGCVSRVEVTQYIHAASALPAIQIDAAINPGNSGGPTLSGDVVVGVAFQNLPSADSIGYIIPNSVVFRFLSETANRGYYPGTVSLGEIN